MKEWYALRQDREGWNYIIHSSGREVFKLEPRDTIHAREILFNLNNGRRARVTSLSVES